MFLQLDFSQIYPAYICGWLLFGHFSIQYPTFGTTINNNSIHFSIWKVLPKKQMSVIYQDLCLNKKQNFDLNLIKEYVGQDCYWCSVMDTFGLFQKTYLGLITKPDHSPYTLVCKVRNLIQSHKCWFVSRSQLYLKWGTNSAEISGSVPVSSIHSSVHPPSFVRHFGWHNKQRTCLSAHLG